jgi:hypothetical protein
MCKHQWYEKIRTVAKTQQLYTNDSEVDESQSEIKMIVRMINEIKENMNAWMNSKKTQIKTEIK